MTPQKNKVVQVAAIISILLIIELFTGTFGRILAQFFPFEDRDGFALPCALHYHLWVILFMSSMSIGGFIYWFFSSVNPAISFRKKSSTPSLRNFNAFLKIDLIQRYIHFILALGMLIYYLVQFKHYYFASGITVRYQFILLTVVLSLFVLQTILNHKWLNSLFKALFFLLLIYVCYMFVFAFLDPNDVTLTREIGPTVKSSQFLLKSGVIVFALWIMNKLVPEKNAANTKQ